MTSPSKTKIERAERARLPKPVRRDLAWIWRDGVAWSVMVGLGESYLAAFTLACGHGETASGLIASAPLVAGAARPDAALWGAVQRILLATGTGPTVGQLALGAGLSERHFRRRFQRAMDLSPKELTRIWRFRRCAQAAAEALDANWAARAADHGFADQSHLVREFRKLVGLAPGEFGRRTTATVHRRVWVPEGGARGGSLPRQRPDA